MVMAFEDKKSPQATGNLLLNSPYVQDAVFALVDGHNWLGRRSVAHLGQNQDTAPLDATFSVKKWNGNFLANAVRKRPHARSIVMYST